MFLQPRCHFHGDNVSNIYVSPIGKRDEKDFSLEWVDHMATVIHPEDPELQASFITCYKAPLHGKEQADLAYQYARRYCHLNIQHLKQQAEAIRDSLIAQTA